MGDKGRINNYNIKRRQDICRDSEGIVEIIEHKTFISLPLAVVLTKEVITVISLLSNILGLHQILCTGHADPLVC